MPRSKLDVAVVGAGVIGLAIARELAHRRVRVAVFELVFDADGTASTPTNGGGGMRSSRTTAAVPAGAALVLWAGTATADTMHPKLAARLSEWGSTGS